MKLAIILSFLLIFVAGCAVQDTPSNPTINTTNTVSGVQELLLTEQDLAQLGMTSGGYDELHQLGWIDNGTDCKIEEFQTGENSPTTQTGICSYIIESLNDTEIIIQYTEYTNLNDLNGSYQYSSLHLRGAKGLLSENAFGDQSRFYVNNEDDYGAENNPPGVYYYSLYMT
ncbi:MAG: hypothetical protein ACP5NW_01270, partial [Candidatus Woesearchaeota archaeon]